ncbi:cytochrome P450 [Fistulina hepatica ATCC 64428]|uniref:Cytochrome P450 n=1 Tax=Fistulina hepatica ATCC 64428 TaxID=1128425 RepID=A0A0D7AJ45_9AGAR|nr:cytochrome P450 [Fistulina hepatica ATCC 64428]
MSSLIDSVRTLDVQGLANNASELRHHASILLKQNSSLILLGLALPAWCLLRFLLTYGSRGANYPPGPPTLPILGNLLEFPRKYPQYKFGEWARQYGDVISVKVLNQTIIVLHTPTLVRELFDKRAISNSNRPASSVVEVITPGELNVGTAHYAGEEWKVMRKASASLLSKESLRKFSDIQHAEVTQMMIDLVHDPDDWYMHIQRFTSSFTLALVYGKRSPRSTSPDITDFLHVHRRFMAALEFGTAPPADVIPILRYVPAMFAKWKREGIEIRNLQHKLYDRLVDDVQGRLDKGLGNGAFMEDAILHAKEWGMKNKDYLANLGGTLLEGSDTTSASTQYIILCAAAFPEKQQKVAEELERVVGRHRVPRFEDMPNLPYTRAFAEECSRFLPVANLGLPHEMNRDEVIDGVFYPKGAIVFMNTWFMFHDERYFDKPSEFMPERFLLHPLGVKPGIKDDPYRRENMLFGGGRRVCPGTTMARSNLDIIAAYTIWGFHIKPALDPLTGKEVPVDITRFEPGITATPLPFPCRFVARSKEHVEVLQQEFQRAADVMRPYELELCEEDRIYNAKYRDN